MRENAWLNVSPGLLPISRSIGTSRTEPVIIPLAIAQQDGNRSMQTDITISNPGATTATGRLIYYGPAAGGRRRAVRGNAHAKVQQPLGEQTINLPPQGVPGARETVNSPSVAISVLSERRTAPTRDVVAVSVVIPCLNEAESIAQCVSAAQRVLDEHALDGEVIVVDNGSEDGSAALARLAGARVVDEPRRGYGSAYLAGFAAARGTYIVMIDADLTYDFEEIPRFVRELDGGAELVMGNRMQAVEPGAMPLLSRIATSTPSAEKSASFRLAETRASISGWARRKRHSRGISHFATSPGVAEMTSTLPSRARSIWPNALRTLSKPACRPG